MYVSRTHEEKTGTFPVYWLYLSWLLMTKWGMLEWFKHTEDVPVLPAPTAFTASISQNEIPEIWHGENGEMAPLRTFILVNPPLWSFTSQGRKGQFQK